MRVLRAAAAILPFALLGAGLAWWIHPGAGLAAVAVAVWVDLHKETDRS